MGRYLHEIIRHLGISPESTPFVHHRHRQCRIIAGIHQVGFSLIPDETARGEPAKRVDHSVKKLSGMHHIPIQALGQWKIDSGDGFQGCDAHPRLNGSSAPYGGNQSYGDIRHETGKRLSEMISRGAEIAEGVGSAPFPLPGAIFLRGVGIVPFHGEHPDQRGGRRIVDGLVCVFNSLMIPSAERHFHVGLAAAYPDFADKDVVQEYPVAVADTYAVGASGIRSGHFYAPVAPGIGFRAVFGAVPGRDHLNGPVAVGGSPDFDHAVSLQNHPAPKQAGERHFGCRADPEGQQCGQYQDKSFHSAANIAKVRAGRMKYCLSEVGAGRFSSLSE